MHKSAAAVTQAQHSRLDRMLADGQPPPLLPPVPHFAAHLIEHLFDAGPTMAGGLSGAEPLSSAELLAWQDLTGVPLTPWESRTLRRMSRAYAAESREARTPSRPAPWVPDAVETDRREVVSRQIGASLRSMARAQQQLRSGKSPARPEIAAPAADLAVDAIHVPPGAPGRPGGLQ